MLTPQRANVAEPKIINNQLCFLQAFGFINLVLWVGNLWFVFKETGIIAPFMRAPPPQEKPAAPDAYGQQGAYEQDPYASSQGGYQPDYNQQGYNQVSSQPVIGWFQFKLLFQISSMKHK